MSSCILSVQCIWFLMPIDVFPSLHFASELRMCEKLEAKQNMASLYFATKIAKITLTPGQHGWPCCPCPVGLSNEGMIFSGALISFHSLSVHTVKGFLVVNKVHGEVYDEEEFHSSNCSMMIHRLDRLAIWLVQDLFLQKPVCWSLSLVLTASFILSSRIL